MILIPGFLHILTKGSGTQQLVYQAADGEHWQVLATLTEEGSIGVQATHPDSIGEEEMVELANDRTIEGFFSRWRGADVGRAAWLTRLLDLPGLHRHSKDQLIWMARRTPLNREAPKQAVAPA